MSQKQFNVIKEKYKTVDELLTSIIYHNKIEVQAFSEKEIKYQEKNIEMLKIFMKETNKSLTNLQLPEFPLLAAIQQICHPILVEALWKMCPPKIYYKDASVFNKMPHICNAEMRELYLIPAIKDAIKWTYLSIKYSIHNKINNETDKNNAFIYLDKYVKIFGIDCEKISYD